MAKLSKGTTFSDGSSYNAASLNNLVDQASVLPGIITEFASSTPDVADSLLIYDTSASALAKCTITDLIAAFPNDPVAATKGLRSLGTGAQQAAPGNDTRFGATLSGSVGKLRLIGTNGLASNDTGAAPKDLAFASSNLSGGTAIDWDVADIFYDTLSGSAGKTYTFSNVRDGRVITIMLNTAAFTGTITWPTTAGTAPVFAAGTLNIYTFMKSAVSTSPAGVVKQIA